MKEEQVKRVREEIRQAVMPLSKMRAISMTKDMSADRELIADNIANELTSTILSNPHIGIIDDDQKSLPEATRKYADESDKGDIEGMAYVRGYYISQSDMLNANFKKLIKEGVDEKTKV